MASDKKEYERTLKQWTRIINTILEKRPGFLKVRDTDHEFRDDTRDIEEIGGSKIHLSVDSLRTKGPVIWNNPGLRWPRLM